MAEPTSFTWGVGALDLNPCYSLMGKKDTAYHEAGHAIMCLEVGKAFRTVSIEPNEDTLGRLNLLPPKIQPEVRIGLRERRIMESDIKISMAGEAAICILRERTYRNGYWKSGSSRDFEAIMTWLHYMCLHPDEYEPYFKLLWTRTLLHLCTDQRWWAVERVADALLKQATLKRKEVEELCCVEPACDIPMSEGTRFQSPGKNWAEYNDWVAGNGGRKLRWMWNGLEGANID